jgi:hypothetical protein
VARIKLFSVDEAEKTLPLVKRIVGDIVKTFTEREQRVIERQKLPPHPTPGSSNEERAFQLEREIDNMAGDIARYNEELLGIGVELKDLRIGLIDFFSRYEGRIVYLCWKLDEGETLAWWHDLNKGFRGRQPITPMNRQRFKGLEQGERYVELA